MSSTFDLHNSYQSLDNKYFFNFEFLPPDAENRPKSIGII